MLVVAKHRKLAEFPAAQPVARLLKEGLWPRKAVELLREGLA